MAPRKKKKDDQAPIEINEGQEIDVGDSGIPAFDKNALSIEIPHDDGSVTIQLVEDDPAPKETKFHDNLAEHVSEDELRRIGADLLEAIEQDDKDRSEWLEIRADGLVLLGQKIEKPSGGGVGSTNSSGSQSKVRDGLLAEACDRFQANAFAELCPSEGPVKFVSYGSETTGSDKDAENLEKDFNYYLTGSGPKTATEYYPDTRRMLWWTGYASGMFKKVYKCPLRGRPVSESVDGADLIVPSNVTDLQNAGRITHQINMRQSVMKRMQILGVYRDVPLQAPAPVLNALKQSEANVTGMTSRPQREEDQDYTVYECYCELDLPGFEHKQKGKETGLPLPYRVTLDKDSQTILEIRRNWNEPKNDDDKDELPVAKIPFVLFPYATGVGFYGTGLLHRLGNYVMALTAMLRECIDAGMFASFPGFLYAKSAGRQLQNEFRVPPGGGAPIDLGAIGDINKAVMPLPYKDPSAALVALRQQIRGDAERYGGTAESPTGEGVANAPVGSVLAAIDQATRIEGGVHKALHAAQREEFRQLLELFKEDPDPLWAGNERPAMGADPVARREKFLAMIKTGNLAPASDPNVPSHMHRLAKATAYLQTAMTAPPGLFDMKKVIMRWAGMVKIDDIESDFLPPNPNAPQPDPVAMAALQLKAKEVAIKEQALQTKTQVDQAKIQSNEQIQAAKLALQHATATGAQPTGEVDPLQTRALDIKDRQVDIAAAKLNFDAHDSHANRQSKESIEAMKTAQALAVHPDSDGVVDTQLAQMSAFLHPQQPGTTGMAAGGPVEPAPSMEPQHDEQSDEVARAVTTALRLARVASSFADQPAVSPNWWDQVSTSGTPQ